MSTKNLSKKKILYKHQKKILREFPHKHALIWSCGTGKTLTAIELALKSKDICPLFIVPKGLKENWHIELSKYFSDGKNCTLLTKEEFKRDWQMLPKHDALVIDESHYFLGMTSDLSKSLINYIKKWNSEYVWLLTATPYRSSPWDVYRMAEILGKKINYWAFRERFFTEVRFGNRRPIPVIKKGIESDIADIVSELGSVVKIEDCIDIPDQIFETEYLTLTDSQKKVMIGVYDVMPIVRFTKYHQICGGTLKSDGYEEDQYFDSFKLERLFEYIASNRKLIVVCRYNAEVAMIANMFMSVSSNKTIGVITGDVKDRHGVLEKLKGVEDYILIVNAACSEGWELPDCPLMIFYSYSFSLKDYIQMLGRIQRINNIKKNTYLSLVIKDTIDEEVFKALQRKEDFIIAIYESTK